MNNTKLKLKFKKVVPVPTIGIYTGIDCSLSKKTSQIVKNNRWCSDFAGYPVIFFSSSKLFLATNTSLHFLQPYFFLRNKQL